MVVEGEDVPVEVVIDKMREKAREFIDIFGPIHCVIVPPALRFVARAAFGSGEQDLVPQWLVLHTPAPSSSWWAIEKTLREGNGVPVTLALGRTTWGIVGLDTGIVAVYGLPKWVEPPERVFAPCPAPEPHGSTCICRGSGEVDAL